MKKLALALGLSVLVLCGCSTPYVMKLSNGTQILTPSKPKLRGANYYYKDAHGEEHAVPQSRVLELEPAKMAAEEDKFTPAKPKKDPWWKFW